jgi:serine/threonine-protein kinase
MAEDADAKTPAESDRVDHGRTLPQQHDQGSSVRESLRPRSDAPSGASKPDEAAPRIFEHGQIVGGLYEIRDLLGEGGMGQVFEAYDHGLERRIAIKASWPERDRFLRHEAKALATFEHPALPTVYTLGTEDGIDYVAMERLHGLDLAEHRAVRADSGAPFSVEETVELIRAIAEGLSVIHHAGLVHRDLKPENVMLMPGRRVVLMDLGLAIGRADTVQAVIGTPGYMAREGLTGEIRQGEAHLLDVYALGVLAYEMLTGLLPREADSWMELLQTHEHPAPDVRTYREDVPGELASLVGAMVRSRAEDRPQSLEEVLRELKKPGTVGKGEEASQQLRVLVVDDDPDISKVLGFYARRALGELEVQTASNGREALEKMAEDIPDIVLLDLQMPEMSGFEVCMYMQGMRVAGKSLSEHCALIAVSAGAPESDKALLQSMGVQHFVQKGQRLGERLEAALRDICGQS